MLVDDELLHAVAVVAEADRVPDLMRERCGAAVARLTSLRGGSRRTR